MADVFFERTFSYLGIVGFCDLDPQENNVSHLRNIVEFDDVGRVDAIGILYSLVSLLANVCALCFLPSAFGSVNQSKDESKLNDSS